MKIITAIALATLATSASALTTHTTDFLAGYTNYNGFEGAPSGCCFDGTAGYTEQAIAVTYIGTPGQIWSALKPLKAC